MVLPPGDPLVAAGIQELSRELARGGRRPNARLQDGARWELVPEALKTFIATCDLDDLESAVRQRRNLYWHPLVRAQLAHLIRLNEDPHEWNRLGWRPDSEEKPWPKGTIEARRRIQNLITAHAAAMEPGMRVIWKVAPGKPGPKGRLKNPHPRWPVYEWIDAREVVSSFEALRKALDSEDLRTPRVVTASALKTLGSVVRTALEKADPSWSSLVKIIDPPGGTQSTKWDWVEEWPESLVESIAKAVIEGPNDFKRRPEGRPRFIAYTILSKLLETTPAKIRDVVDNYNRAQARRRTTRESSK